MGTPQSDRKQRKRKEKKRQTKQRQEKQQRQTSAKQGESPLRLVKEPPHKSEPMSPPPLSRMSMERTLREFHQALESMEFDSEEDVQKFMDDFNSRGGSMMPDLVGPLSPGEEAQKLAYQAMESNDPDTMIELAMRAVELDHYCVDALVMLAHASSESPKELIENLEKAVWLGARGLGEDFFAENVGLFWGIIETRPYMRARQELADLLFDEGRIDEAVTHYEVMLKLNPNDNQGVRDSLLACYLTQNNLEGAKRLLDQYNEDCSAAFAWSRVLECHLAGNEDQAAKLLAEARQNNPFAEPYLTGKKRLPANLPPYYSPGDESEAQCVAVILRPAWKKHRTSAEWLKAQK